MSYTFTAIAGTTVHSAYSGVMQALKETGVRVPEDVSIVGPSEELGITRITVDSRKKGEVAVEKLIEQATCPEWKPRRVYIKNSIEAGSSTRRINR